MTTFYVPIELYAQPMEKRWFFHVVEAADKCDATMEACRFWHATPRVTPPCSVWGARDSVPEFSRMEALRNRRGGNRRTRAY